MAKIYVASSWKNPFQPNLVVCLRAYGHEVYDFRNPEGRTGFSWSQIPPEHTNEDISPVNDPSQWSPFQYMRALEHPIAEAGFKADFDAMKWADTFVLLLPCGRSAHLELGWAAGAGKQTYIMLTEDPVVPELMYKMATKLVKNRTELLRELSREEQTSYV